MTNSKAIFQDLIRRLDVYTDKEEVRSIAFLVMEHVFNISRTEILAGKEIPASVHEEQFEEIIKRIKKYEPIQYILGEALFSGRRFKVNPAVLIPRQETEELVSLALSGLDSKKDRVRILDIGTGSGCIAVTLALQVPNADVFASDVSGEALKVATANAESLGATITFFQHDILEQELPFSEFDLIVSNPPYIAISESEHMSAHVISYEPHLALFVSDEDPLKFYRAIVTQSRNILEPGGSLITEINERLGRETAEIFVKGGLKSTQVIRDINGKERIVLGKKV